MRAEKEMGIPTSYSIRKRDERVFEVINNDRGMVRIRDIETDEEDLLTTRQYELYFEETDDIK